jgi:uncharacterized protein
VDIAKPSTRANEFQPNRLLRNPHLQSVLASSGLRRWLFRRRRAALDGPAIEHILECADGVRLQGFHTPQQALPEPRGLIVLLHGWEGSANSTYLLHAGASLLGEGYDVFRLNFRDHGSTHHLNREMFHSCRLDEVVDAVKAISARFPDLPMAIAGFSLGGNFALRVALRAPAAGIELRHAIAICPAIHPPSILDAIEQAPWFYHAYFMRKWRESLSRKQALFPQSELFTSLELASSMRELTRTMVERHTAFGSLENYLEGYSIAGDRLAALQVPTSILTAADDPIIPVADFRALQLAPGSMLEIAPHGGHCGFIHDLSLRSFAEEFIAARLAIAFPVSDRPL